MFALIDSLQAWRSRAASQSHMHQMQFASGGVVCGRPNVFRFVSFLIAAAAFAQTPKRWLVKPYTSLACIHDNHAQASHMSQVLHSMRQPQPSGIMYAHYRRKARHNKYIDLGICIETLCVCNISRMRVTECLTLRLQPGVAFQAVASTHAHECC